MRVPSMTVLRRVVSFWRIYFRSVHGAQSAKEPVDQTWCDDGVIPEKTNPDTDFIFERMTQATFRTVDARRGERVLDVGCGRGLDLASQRETGAILFGSDASRVMIGKSADTFRDRDIAPRFSHASAEKLPFLDGSFDKVYCKGAIDHFYDPRGALKEMARVLKPGGRLIVSVANFESLACRLGKLYNRLHIDFTGKAVPGPPWLGDSRRSRVQVRSADPAVHAPPRASY